MHTTRRQTLTFDQPIAESATRLVVRYDHVEILDQRNEAYARTLAEVGTGDEVEILELAEAWALVRTPHDVTGWLPTMTIGAPQAAPEAPAPAQDPDASVPRGEGSRAATGRSTGRRRSKGNAPAG